MPFKVRDLMIDVLPEAGGGANLGCYPGTRITCFAGTCDICTQKPTIDCNPTFWQCLISCTCTGCTRTCPPISCPKGSCGWSPPIDQFTELQTVVLNQPGMVANPQNLKELKAQLRQALAQVEAQERMAEESMRPQSLEEADMLEQKLTEALEELRQHREELRRRSAGEDQ
jgi:hypothetical protein